MNNPTVQFLTNLYDRALAGIPVLDGIDGTRDLDKECGYQNFIQDNDYVRMFRRGDVAARVVTLEPDECWKELPSIYETEEERDTEFEKAVDRLEAKTRFFSYLHRLDRVSGILRYGVMLIGMDDGNGLDIPAPGYDEHNMLPAPATGTNIIYYRVFTEASVSVLEWETDPTNPRFNHPLYYNLNFNEVTNSSNTSYTTERVHWSRILHVADNLIESEILGQPRMENVWNRLMDLRKVAGGSGEMFWKGGFPGLSFEVDPKHGEFSTEEREALRDDVKMYAEGLQRYITMVGVTVKSIAPQIADPTNHTKNLLTLIAMTKAIPMQTFMGSQQGQLDSPQDTITWRERIMLRKERYVTPSIIRPFIDRLIQVGALPTPVPQEDQPLPYMVKWEPMAPLNIMEQAKVAKDFAEALARYATSGSEAIIPRPEFLGKVMGYSGQQVQAIESAPPTEHSLVFKQLEGMTGSAGGNAPSSIPKVPKPGNRKDPSKTPTNTVQRAK